MSRVTLAVPRILRETVDGRSTVGLDAGRLDAARDEIRRRWPTLATHVFTDTGDLRPHVLMLHNDDLLPRGAVEPRPLETGDRLEIVQAVSGG